MPGDSPTSAALLEAYRNGDLLPSEHVADLLDRMESAAVANAHVHIDRKGALAAAARADDIYRVGTDVPALCGLPVSVKDLLDVGGQPTGRGRGGVVAPATVDAPVVAKLRRAGVVFMGKTRTSEDGWSASTVGPSGPPTVNPRLPGRSSGGSSGGAACAVALGLEGIALGTDGAGSVRIPAAWCGVVGFKPTWERWPYGPRGDVLSHVGPLTTSVADAVLVDAVVTGCDPADLADVSSPRVAWLAGRSSRFAEDLLRESLVSALGVSVPIVDLGITAAHRALVALLAVGEHSRLVVGDWWPGHAAVALRGALVSQEDIAEAHRIRKALRLRFDALLREYDVLALPTVSIAPFAQDAEWPSECDADHWLAWAENTFLLNLTGHPAITLPWGCGPGGEPLGLQLVGHRHGDRALLAVARHLEARAPTMNRTPS